MSKEIALRVQPPSRDQLHEEIKDYLEPRFWNTKAEDVIDGFVLQYAKLFAHQMVGEDCRNHPPYADTNDCKEHASNPNLIKREIRENIDFAL